ncbi:MAG: DUF2442 domain-containing protein [Brevinema sp.]
MFHKVQSVLPQANFMLLVHFKNGESRHYDIKPLFSKWQEFRALQNIEGLFTQVKVDAGGYGISWNEELDISSEELYFNGIVANQFNNSIS